MIEVQIRKFNEEVRTAGILRELKKRQFFRSRSELRRLKDFIAQRRREKKDRGNHGIHPF